MIAVIIPVGPGHKELSRRAIASVPLGTKIIVVDDPLGHLGRSAARNIGMECCHADWYFFLDADDVLCPGTLELCDPTTDATFGSVCLDSKIKANNVYPCGWREIAKYGADGTLSMGFFCRGDVARRLRFNETLDAGEDFDFYLRLDSFTKLDRPLVKIGYDLPSAGGPRGYERIDWVSVCNQKIAEAIAREPWKYDFGGDAILATA